ncbi:MAG: hypothetical protein M3Q72_00515 [Actinomycetota bacterium]|nr:hypothetical protein [Actinomycetota bacterium]
MPQIRRILIAVCLVALAGCRLDAEVAVEMQSDGTGTVTVTATADAGLVDEVPDLAGQLDLSDARDAGWRVGEITETADGGARLTLTHDFGSAREATALVRSFGGPLSGVTIRHVVDGEEDDADASATNSLTGTARLAGGFDAFADRALVTAVGGKPFSQRLGDRSPADTMSITLSAELPGTLEETNGEQDGAITRWELPLDGSEQQLRLVTAQRPDEGAGWAGPLATIALVALIAWVVAAAGFVAYVFVRRAQR